MSVISDPFRSVSWTPCRTVSIPRVTMMEGIRPAVTSSPFVNPKSAPIQQMLGRRPAATGQCA